MCKVNRLEMIEALGSMDRILKKSCGFQHSRNGKFYLPLKKPIQDVMQGATGNLVLKAYNRRTEESYMIAQDTFTDSLQSCVATQYNFELLVTYLDAQWDEARWRCCRHMPYTTQFQTGSGGSVWLRVDDEVYVGLAWSSDKESYRLMMDAMYSFALTNIGHESLFNDKEYLSVSDHDRAIMSDSFKEAILTAKENAKMLLSQPINIDHLFFGFNPNN